MSPIVDWWKVRADAAAAISDAEERAIDRMLDDAEVHGYGNMMAWLAAAWAVKLIEDGMSQEGAIHHVSNRSPYSVSWFCGHAEEGQATKKAPEVNQEPLSTTTSNHGQAKE